MLNSHDLIRDQTNKTTLLLHGGLVSLVRGDEFIEFQAIFVNPNSLQRLGFAVNVFGNDSGVFALHSDVSEIRKGDRIVIGSHEYEAVGDLVVGSWNGLTGIRLMESTA